MLSLEITVHYFRVLNRCRRQIENEVEYRLNLRPATPAWRRETRAVAIARCNRKGEGILLLIKLLQLHRLGSYRQTI